MSTFKPILSGNKKANEKKKGVKDSINDKHRNSPDSENTSISKH